MSIAAVGVAPDHKARLIAGQQCLEAAIEYSRLGWAVVSVCDPHHLGERKHATNCESPGKAPTLPWEKLYKAERPKYNEAELRAAWDRNPTRNVGGIMGGVSGNLAAIDIDGAGGEAMLQEVSGGDLPETVEFKTPGGGRRLIYTAPAGVRLKTTHKPLADAKHSGVSYIAEGGHTVLPPSRHANGGRYEWLPGKSILQRTPAPAPAWLVEKLRVNPSETKKRTDQVDAATGDYPPYDPTTVAQLCAFVKHCIDDAAELSEPEWMSMARIQSHGVGGREWVHKASENYHGYSAAETDRKIDESLAVKPHTCKHVAELTGNRYCGACQWKGEINSPVALATIREDGSTRPPGEIPPKSITNGVLVEVEDKEGKTDSKTQPMPMADILASIKAGTGDWPRRAGGALFIDRTEGQIDWLETAASVFGWLGSKTGVVRWHRGIGFATKEETFFEFRRTATNYQAVETLPHFPPISGHYYSCKPVKRGDGSTLRALLERFNPSTQIDQDLFLAAMVTPFWGGPPGCRPAFMWTSDSGRGAGKSKNAAMIARVAGGIMDFSHGEDIASMKARILSPEGQGCRVAMLDNVKTLRFSWAEIESLITQTTISGKRMYVGEANRPNTLTWFVTLNGASLSTDLAQRIIPIKIDPPKRVGSWEEDTIKFIDDHRQSLVDDIAAFFERPTRPPREFSRWATWEQHVLGRLPEPDEAQAVIRERQAVADVEREEADIIEGHFRNRLMDLCYAVETERVHIPSLLACQWFNEAAGEKKGTTASTRAIKQLCDESKLRCLQLNRCNTYGRGFLWVGEEAQPDAAIRTDLTSRIDTQKRRA